MRRPDSPAPDSAHPSPTTWLVRMLESPDAGAGREAERHALRCSPCRALRESARILVRAARPGMFETVPLAARRRAEAAFLPGRKPTRPRDSAPLGRLRVVGASGLLERAGLSSTAGIRGAAGERHCRLEGGAHRIDLEWMQEGSSWQLRGRVASEPGAAMPRLLLELAAGGLRRIAPGPRGFFGPVRMSRPELRVRLETSSRQFRSRWIPAVPRPRPASPRKPRG